MELGLNKPTFDVTLIQTRSKIISDREEILINKPIKIWIKDSGFNKEYLTNSEGNLLINKNEVLPYFPAEDSTISLNISYQNKITQIWLPQKFIKN
ncbi:MAG: hypothetical protein ABIN61_08460 [candidate division WOR-3 bacterium]